MNKNQQKLAYYAQLINQIVTETEAEQDQMSPKFEELKAAEAAKTIQDFDAQAYQATKTLFTNGTTHYQQMLAQLEAAQAPARLLGNHKLLTSAFRDFTQGCVEMVASLHDAPAEFDQAAFDAAEAKQDAATTKLMKHIAKITA
ncbi:hypothetical protein ACFQ5J_08900 [Lacticaseibacillus baoqingensis]|uniref:DUF2383 domain-containing protein n=1 Tax=Lacticaseibacillus baoqingensis TaxID=2486013 RepID=A0ABW4EA94_9LACO|nr:hypothetical protein [Lacticaseibacillus baoqingensis]